jgi:hypothetical protein
MPGGLRNPFPQGGNDHHIAKEIHELPEWYLPVYVVTNIT